MKVDADMDNLARRDAQEERDLVKQERIRRLRDELIEPDLEVDELAAILDLERSTVLRYLRESVIIGYKSGRTWRIPEAEVHAYKNRLLDHERKEHLYRTARAEVESQFNLWSRTQPHKQWLKQECPQCGQPMLTQLDQEWDPDYEVSCPVRVGKCRICSFAVTEAADGMTPDEQAQQ